jgi:hypothetical protein
MNTFPSVVKTFILLAICIIGSFNHVLAADVAKNDPACSLYYFHNNSLLETKSSASLTIRKNDFVGLVWNATNITDGIDIQGKKIPALGFEIVVPNKDVSYTYTFNQGSKKVTCSLSITVLSGEFSSKETYKRGEKITIAGSVIGTKKVIIDFNSSAKTVPVYSTKPLTVLDQKFRYKLPKVLPDDTYTVIMKTVGANSMVVATTTVRVGKVKYIPATTLVVQKVPLLSGGSVKASTEVPVAYIQIINVGENPSIINALAVRQVGSAPVSAITKMSVIDQFDTINGSIGNGTSISPFITDTAKIPTQITLAPKESRLFTIRASVAGNVPANIGRTISLALLGLESNSIIASALPVYNPNWTIVP